LHAARVLSGDPREQAADESGGDGAAFRLDPRRTDLVELTEREPAVRQARIHARVAEGEHAVSGSWLAGA
jgi:hypothetical protein